MKLSRFVCPRLWCVLCWSIGLVSGAYPSPANAAKTPIATKEKPSERIRPKPTTRPTGAQRPIRKNAKPGKPKAPPRAQAPPRRPGPKASKGKPGKRRPKKRPKRNLMPSFESTTRVRRYRAPTAASGEVDQRRLETYAQNQAADTLQAVPGLLASQHTGRGKAQQFFLRGFDAVHGSDLELRVQGIPLNEASNIHGQGYADIGFIPGLAMLRLRYLKGPFTGQQGDFAITGTLEWDLGLSQRGVLIQAGLGSFLRKEIAIAWGPTGMSEETFVIAQIGESNGFGTNRGWLEGKAMAQVKLRWKRYWLQLMAGLHYNDFGSAGVLRERDLLSGRVDFYDAQQDGLGGHTGRWIAQAILGWRGEQSRARFMMYAIGRDLRLKENFTGRLIYEKGDTFEQRHRFVQVGALATWRREWYLWARRQELEVGAELRYDGIEQVQHRLDAKDTRHITEIDAQVQGYQISAWATLRLHLARWFQWSTSLRASMLGLAVEELAPPAQADLRGPSRSGVGLHLAPRTNLRFRLSRRWRMFASYGMGFRSVQARSLSDGQRTPFQEAHSAELGVRFKVKNWFQASLAAFGTYVAQELIFDHATANNLYAGPSWRGGGELDLRARLYFKWLWFDTSVAYSEGVFATDGTPVPFAPRLLMRNGLVVRWHSPTRFWRLVVALRTSLLGPRPLPQGVQADTIFLLNAVLKVGIGPFFVRIDGQNILNQQWKDGQFVYASAFQSGVVQKLPQVHYTAGHPLQAFVTVGVQLFSQPTSR